MRKITNSAGRRRRDADQADEPAVVDVVLRHRRAIAADEVRLLRLVAEQRALLPLVEQEVVDRASYVRPQRLAVGLEHRPLRSLVDRVLEEREVAAQVHVLPLGIRAHRARAPEAVAAALEETEAVDALRVQHLLLGLVQQLLETDREVDDLVCRRLVDRAVDVVAGVDPGDESRRRHDVRRFVIGSRISIHG